MNSIRRLSFAACMLLASCACAQDLRVLSLNIMVDAVKSRVPGIAELIRRSGADVVGLQETDKATADIAKLLGYHYLRLGEDTAVLSRFELSAVPGAKHGARVLLGPGREVLLFDFHLMHAPYQPYQLLGIPYENGRFIQTEAEAIAEAKAARGTDVAEGLREIERASGGAPVIVTGDFNEPSFLDWTGAAARARRHPIKVEWPSTKAFADAGFRDAYREIFPDEMARPGFTWTPTTRPDDPKDHHDRIDFVLFRGAGLRPLSAQVVGENPENSDIAIDPYPTDHRGVVAGFSVAPPAQARMRRLDLPKEGALFE